MQRPIRSRRRANNGVGKAIATLKVKGLFGQFDYEFPASDSQAHLPSDVVILYGDNGSGKTTLLNLTFHSLSAANNRGHRSAVAQIPFRRFEITLGDGSKIAMWRDSELTGGYWICLERADGPVLQTNFSIQRERKFASDEHEREFISFLKHVGQSIYFVSADRRILNDELPADSEMPAAPPFVGPEDADRVYEATRRFFAQHRPTSERPEALRAPSLMQAMELARSWITHQVLRAANRGTGSTHVIYSQVVKNIATSRVHDGSVGQELVDGLTSTLQSLSARSKGYARFGFTGELDVREMVELIRNAPAHDVPLIARVLQPYVEGTNASLDELTPVYKVTSLLIDLLAGFYTAKTVSFNLNRGFVVRGAQDNKRIDPMWLSSGEQQLLLLFCYALAVSDRDSIFIIDEPELSLNIKWQRKLIQSLLDIVAGGRVQFMFASHSIELVGEHLDKVLKLEPSTENAAATEADARVGPTHNS